MDLGQILKDLGARSSLLWGVALGSACLLLVDTLVSPLGLPSEWWWALPVVVGVSWAILLTGLVSMGAPVVARKWKARGQRETRKAYALRNLETAGGFERAVLLHYKRENRQRFRARRDAQAFREMVRHGFLDNDSLDAIAYMQHYRVTDVVWKFLDAPPAGWGRGRVLAEINWE